MLGDPPTRRQLPDERAVQAAPGTVVQIFGTRVRHPEFRVLAERELDDLLVAFHRELVDEDFVRDVP